MTRRGWALVSVAALAGLGAAVYLGYPRHSQHGQDTIHVLWSFEPVSRGAIISSPRIGGERIYAAFIEDNAFTPTSTVYCLNRHTGKVLWKFNDDGQMQHTFSSPCLADGRLYIGEGMHANYVCKLYCLDADTGKKHWDFTAKGHIESSPCVAEGKVYFGAGDDGLYCLNAVTGAPCWHFQGPYHIDTSPVVAGERLYGGSGVSVQYQTSETFCIDANTGKVVWRVQTDLPAWGAPQVKGGQAFFGLGNGRINQSDPHKPAGALLCLDAAHGELIWRFDAPDSVLGQPAVDENHVYLAARDGYCRCLDRETGNQLWKQALGSAVVAHPALHEGRLYVVASGGRISCLEAQTGKPLWTYNLPGRSALNTQMLSSPAVVDDMRNGARRLIYFGAELRNPAGNAAVLYCLRELSE